MSNVTGSVTEREEEATTTIHLPTDEPPSTPPPQDGILITAIVIVCIVVVVVAATAVICAVVIKRRKTSRPRLSRVSYTSHTSDNVQPETPSPLGAPVPEEGVTAAAAAAGVIHGDNCAKAESPNTDLEESHSSSNITLSIHSTRIHVPRAHLTDRYIFRESGRAFSLMSNRSYDSNRAFCTDSCWRRPCRPGRQCPSVLSSEVQHDVIVSDICSSYEGLVLGAGFPDTDHYTYLHALYRASEALSSVDRESVIYEIAICPGRASYTGIQPDHYTYLDVLHCPLRPGSVNESDSVIYDIINDLEGNAGETAGQYTHIYNVHRNARLHTRPLFASGDYAIPFEASTSRHSLESDFRDVPNPMHPDIHPTETSSLARYSSETNYYDMPCHMRLDETSSLARYSSETNYYDMPCHMRLDDTSSLARYSSETNYYDMPCHMRPNETSSLARYSSETNYYDMPCHMRPDETSSLARYSSETNYYDMPCHMRPDETSSLPRYSSEIGHYDMPTHP